MFMFKFIADLSKRIGALVFVLGVSGAISAGPITIQNYDFEADPMVLDLRPTAYLNLEVPTGWQSTGNALSAKYLVYSHNPNGANSPTVFNGLVPHGPTEFHNGQTLAFSSTLGVSASGSMFQQTGAAITANTGYELAVDVFDRWDLDGFSEATFSFFAGNVNNTIKTWQLSEPRFEGYFDRQYFSVLADDLLAFQGLNLGIAFTQISHSSLIIDNVGLRSFYSAPTPPPAPVPAPPMYLLLGLALIGIGCLRKFSSRSKG